MNRTIGRAAVTLTATTALALAGAVGASAETGQLVYSGQSEITITQSSYCGFSGEPVPISQETFTAPVTLIVADPVRDRDGGAEQNPVHFTLQTDQQQVAAGGWSITTGLVATTPETGRELAVQYWTDHYDPSTGELTATLTEDHIEEGLAYNSVSVEQLLVPCQPQHGTIPMLDPMGEGTQLVGTLDASTASMEIAGVSSDQLTEFHIRASLQRNS